MPRCSLQSAIWCRSKPAFVHTTVLNLYSRGQKNDPLFPSCPLQSILLLILRSMDICIFTHLPLAKACVPQETTLLQRLPKRWDLDDFEWQSHWNTVALQLDQACVENQRWTILLTQSFSALYSKASPPPPPPLPFSHSPHSTRVV